MRLYNIKNTDQQLGFKEAVLQGIGLDGGLFFPKSLPIFSSIDNLLAENFIPRSSKIMQHILKDEFPEEVIDNVVRQAFNFPIGLKKIENNIFALELFLGQTLAFKDFGARFMANILGAITKEKITIITATSGDTGAAVAHAFHGIDNIQVVVLYPNKKISELQEKMFCTIGGNIHTFAVNGNFDDCQLLVKQSFADKLLGLKLNTANSINISRVLAQSLYYFEAIAGLSTQKNIVVSVPSGNFGNLTAGLFARSMGLPITAFIASTNANDTVPRYLENGKWQPHDTISTLSNAMDVSQPNNWPRIEELCKKEKWHMDDVLRGVTVSEEQTKQAMLELQSKGYVADPHSAIAYHGLKTHLNPGEIGVFLCTAHPAKFKDSVDSILKTDIPLPGAIKEVSDKEILSKFIDNDYSILRKELMMLV